MMNFTNGVTGLIIAAKNANIGTTAANSFTQMSVGISITSGFVLYVN